jgi:tRNA (cmo5U34)-methyltransferase
VRLFDLSAPEKERMNDMSQIEEMGAFFDRRVDGYEEHMRSILDIDGFYGAVAGALPQSDEPLRILDLGCGTGLELSFLFGRLPQARVTGIDLSGAMLDQLRDTYRDRMGQITLIRDNYAACPLGESYYDHAVSVQSLHHFPPEEKTAVYRNIARALRPGGAYAEGDFVVTAAEEKEYLNAYRAAHTDGGLYHLDIPLTVERQIELFKAAGFCGVDLLYHADAAAVFRAAKG